VTEVGAEQVVLRRPKKSQLKQRPKSEIYSRPAAVNGAQTGNSSVEAVTPVSSGNNLKPSESVRRSKRYSAFGGTSPFGKIENYIRLEQLGEGSYATVYKGYSK
jgi:hypothetical protein